MTNNKIKKQAAIYIVFMAVIIFFSKTIYNFSVPKVTVSLVSQGALNKTLTGYGQLQFLKTYDVFAEIDGQVTAIYAEKDDALQSLADIAQIEYQAEQADIEQAEAELERLELSLAALETEKSNLEQERADLLNQPDIDTTVTDLEIAALEADIENKKAEADRQQILYQAGAIPQTEYDAAVAAVTDAENNLLLKRATVQSAIDADSESKQNELRTLETTLSDINSRLSQSNLDITRSRSQLSAMKDGKAQTVQNKDTAGVITDLYIQEGEWVAKGSKIATVGVRNASFTMEVIETKENAGFVNLNDEAEFSVNGQTADAVATSITPEADSLRIGFTIMSDSFTGGEYGKLTLEKTTQEYEMLVPNDAVMTGATGSSIWILKQGSGTLGNEYYAQSVRVFVADHDEDYTAIAKGITPWEYIIVNPDGELENNARVMPG